jgi:ParB/RepB/Spo0J family partition protein
MQKDTKTKSTGESHGSAAVASNGNGHAHTGTVLFLSTADIDKSPWNRPDGSGFDDKQIAELAASIREKGIIQPLVVRKHPNPKAKTTYELICGERRWSAAKTIKLDRVPCLVREVTDNEARELQIIENLHREGLHPIEEAKGYSDLLAQKNPKGQPVYTIESLAQKLGKSVAFLYGRIKLLKMPEIAQEMMWKGKLSASVALLLCRIPDPKLAEKATLEVLDDCNFGSEEEKRQRALNKDLDPMSFRRAKQHIQDKYMIRLKGAPFDQENPELVPVETIDGERRAGGKCSDCPWRTGNMKALFGDVDSADVCTNPTCFKKKKDSAFKREAAKAKEDGRTLLKDTQAARIFSEGELHSHDYVDLKDTVPGKRKTWEQLLGDDLPEGLVQARDDKRKMHLLLPADKAREVAKKLGVNLPAPKPKADPEQEWKKEQEKRDRAKAKGHALVAAAFPLLMKAAHATPTLAWWRFTAGHCMSPYADTFAQTFSVKSGDDLLKHIETQATEDQCRAFLIAALFCTRPVDWQGEINETFTDACAFYAVDLKKLTADLDTKARAEAAQPKPAEPAKPAPAAAPAPKAEDKQPSPTPEAKK